MLTAHLRLEIHRQACHAAQDEQSGSSDQGKAHDGDLRQSMLDVALEVGGSERMQSNQLLRSFLRWSAFAMLWSERKQIGRSFELLFINGALACFIKARTLN